MELLNKISQNTAGLTIEEHKLNVVESLQRVKDLCSFTEVPYHKIEEEVIEPYVENIREGRQRALDRKGYRATSAVKLKGEYENSDPCRQWGSRASGIRKIVQENALPSEQYRSVEELSNTTEGLSSLLNASIGAHLISRIVVENCSEVTQVQSEALVAAENFDTWTRRSLNWNQTSAINTVESPSVVSPDTTAVLRSEDCIKKKYKGRDAKGNHKYEDAPMKAWFADVTVGSNWVEDIKNREITMIRNSSGTNILLNAKPMPLPPEAEPDWHLFEVEAIVAKRHDSFCKQEVDSPKYAPLELVTKYLCIESDEGPVEERVSLGISPGRAVGGLKVQLKNAVLGALNL